MIGLLALGGICILALVMVYAFWAYAAHIGAQRAEAEAAAATFEADFIPTVEEVADAERTIAEHVLCAAFDECDEARIDLNERIAESLR